jgi:hypothetical protein
MKLNRLDDFLKGLIQQEDKVQNYEQLNSDGERLTPL